MRQWVATALLVPFAMACQAADTPDDNERVVLRNLVETDLAQPRIQNPRLEGTLVPTPSDAKSQYYLLRARKTANDTIIAIVRQEMNGKAVYARTETDCAKRLFHIVGVANNRRLVETDVAYDGPLRSIEGLPLRQEIARFVCERSGTPLASA